MTKLMWPTHSIMDVWHQGDGITTWVAGAVKINFQGNFPASADTERQQVTA